MFDTVQICIETHLRSEPKTIECSFAVSCVVDEESDVVDLLFLAEFIREQGCEWRRSGLKQLHVQELVRSGSTAI